jgi:hypothetical protein
MKTFIPRVNVCAADAAFPDKAQCAELALALDDVQRNVSQMVGP